MAKHRSKHPTGMSIQSGGAIRVWRGVDIYHEYRPTASSVERVLGALGKTTDTKFVYPFQARIVEALIDAKGELTQHYSELGLGEDGEPLDM